MAVASAGVTCSSGSWAQDAKTKTDTANSTPYRRIRPPCSIRTGTPYSPAQAVRNLLVRLGLFAVRAGLRLVFGGGRLVLAALFLLASFGFERIGAGRLTRR